MDLLIDEWKQALKSLCNQRYKLAHKEKVREDARRWQANNLGKHREASRRWRVNNPEKHRKSADRWQSANRERRCEKARLWRDANREKVREGKRVKKHRRRARKLKTTGSFTIEQFKVICAHFKNRCLKCGEQKKL